MKRIYLDYASLTPIDPRVRREMERYSASDHANPSSIYMEGVAARKAVDEARKRIGASIGAHADEIVFTSGGTEANALALEGTARAAHREGNQKPHLVISAIEHSSIMETAAMMERQGVEVTRLPVGADGLVSAEELKKAIKPTTFMVSIMLMNNEIGSIQPIREIAKAVRHARASRYPLLHTDAAQGAAYLDLNVERLGVDLMTLDAGKAYGPRGIGALYVRRDIGPGSSKPLIEPLIYGGGQESSLRSGTENVPAIMGFARALEIAADDREEEQARLFRLKLAFFTGLKELRPDASSNPPGAQIDAPTQAPNILSVSIPGIDNEMFVLRLDAHGVAASTKSSCLRDEADSYVLRAVGADSRTAVRFSFGRWTGARDTARTLKVIAKILRF